MSLFLQLRSLAAGQGRNYGYSRGEWGSTSVQHLSIIFIIEPIFNPPQACGSGLGI